MASGVSGDGLVKKDVGDGGSSTVEYAVRKR